MNETEVRERLGAIAAAERRLRRTVESLDDGDLRAPSWCDGWTRGHVLAHVALNARSLVNLMDWARTGVETPQYAGWAEREGDIARLSSGSRDEHLRGLDAASAEFAAAAARVPLDRWSFEVRGIGGDLQPAGRFLFARLREVEIHHVDLRAGYTPRDWDPGFVRSVLEQVPGRLGPHVEEPFTATAVDAGIDVKVGEGEPVARVEGPAHVLLAWLLGRGDGDGLGVTGDVLPSLPAWG
ncbi:MAG: maleylpyruvate isomerase family mycothiol-dependent enzyme [Actinomycetota bacterium]